MNRLQIVQQLVVECGAGNVNITTTLSQTGEAARFVGWSDAAWLELQTEHSDWTWMRSSSELGAGVSFVPGAGTPNVPFGAGAGKLGIQYANFSKWVNKSFRNYVTTAGKTSEIFMDVVDYDVYRDGYLYGALRNVQTRPTVVAVAPDQSLMVGPPSNGLYTCTGDYFIAPTAMAADTDTPTNLPVRFHMLIVYKAMLKYAGYEAAPEVMDRAQSQYDELFRELDTGNFGPMVMAGSALA